MRHAWVPIVTCYMIAFAPAATAQPTVRPHGPPSVAEPLTPEQDRELGAWLTEMEKWLRDEGKWFNRPRRDGWGRIVARQPPPDAPSWLPEYCASSAPASATDRTTRACRLLADPRAELEAAVTQATVRQAETPQKHTSFLTRVHLDGLWATTPTHGRVYGLVGSHVSLVDAGRLQIFGPPGVLVLSIPQADGSRRIALGYTWGVSLRLTDVRLFGDKDLTLFLNLSKVWLDGGRGFDIVGFSLAPRRKE